MLINVLPDLLAVYEYYLVDSFLHYVKMKKAALIMQQTVIDKQQN